MPILVHHMDSPKSMALFLFYGLTSGVFLATEAASSLGLCLGKSVIFRRFGALTAEIALKGPFADVAVPS
jgi:hypothetical protein